VIAQTGTNWQTNKTRVFCTEAESIPGLLWEVPRII